MLLLQLSELLHGNWWISQAVNPLDETPQPIGQLALQSDWYHFTPDPTYFATANHRRFVPWVNNPEGPLRWVFELDLVWSTPFDDLFKLQQQLQLPLGMRIATVHFVSGATTTGTHQFNVMWMPMLQGWMLTPAFHATLENSPFRVHRSYHRLRSSRSREQR